MATSYTPKGGGKNVDYNPPGHRRQTIRLGMKATEASAVEFKKRIDILVACKKLGEFPDVATLEWAKRIDRKYYKQLARVGLLRLREAYTCGELLTWFVKERTPHVTASTISKVQDDGDSFLDFIGKDTAIDLPTPSDAANFREWLYTQGGRYRHGLAAATISRRCRRLSEIFEAAVKARWIDKNPFAAMGHWNERNEDRDRYILIPTLDAILEQSSCHKLNLMLGLSRFAGLRGTSEFQHLRWEWIDWTHGTIKVYAPKTQRYESVRYRIIPINKALSRLLKRVWTIGETMVFPETLNHQRISGRIETICKHLDMLLWPKPFTNLRASCERDWFAAGHPIDAVTTWMGHSPETALRHYNRFVKEQVARRASDSLQPKNEPDTRSENRSSV